MPKQSEPIVHPLDTEDKEDFNTVLKHQSSSASSSTGAQLESTMEPINKEESVSIVSDQVDPVSIVSKPIAQSLETNETVPVSISSDSVLQVPKLKLKRSRQKKRQLKRRVKMLSTVEQGNDDSSNTTKILVENIFKFLITFINAFFNLLNSPTGKTVLWA